MFLKRMVAQGFKSFAYKTEIIFNDGLTIIVGPNGSGKSNINDAIKWVLGETSKKNLRASDSKDVIFSGADTEKASDFAEVTLIFNNEEKILNIDYTEVSVTRRSYRNEDQNEYFINKTKVRRKDVKNLFLDTGLGNTDLSIISQSSVTKIAEAKPAELRNVINEAAGVAKYEQQKQEATRKLERVGHNLEIFEVKLTELEKTVKPLLKQKDKAEKFIKIRDELALIELSLMKTILSEAIPEKELLDNRMNDDEDKKISMRSQLEQMKQKMQIIQETLIESEDIINDLQSKQSTLAQSRQINTNTTDVSSLEENIKTLALDIKEVRKLEEEANDEMIEAQEHISTLKDDKHSMRQLQENLRSKISRLENEKLQISSNKKLGRGTQVILDNINIFDGVHGLLSSVIKVNDEHQLALEVGIGAALNNIIVEDEKVVSEAIHFLKSNKYGNATFVPANKVKPRYIPEEVLSAIENLNGFEGTLESLIKTNKAFSNVVASVAGNLLVFDNIDNAMRAAKVLDYKFKMVTIDGDILFPGFVVRGGYNKTNSTVQATKDLENQISENSVKFDSLLNEINSLEERTSVLDENQSTLRTNVVRYSERRTYLETTTTNLLEQYEQITGKEFDIKKVKGSNESIDGFSLEKINALVKTEQDKRKSLMVENQKLIKEEDDLRNLWMKHIEMISENTIRLDHLLTLIDSELLILNRDYKLTYEGLADNDEIAVITKDIEKSTNKRESLRQDIDDLGFINIEAIEEYEKISGEYEELRKNTDDLRSSRKSLMETIETMDKLMTEKFGKMFKEINIKFDEVFKILFRGGSAKLTYSDPENILESGIEISVKAPGKVIESMSLFSGGEKSLAALSLIFSINLVRNLPLLILDEPEAALDEANVERFAKFAKEINKTSQVLITTHRPGTMEMADVIYGVTMQPKGITKIVSVKLEDAVELIS